MSYLCSPTTPGFFVPGAPGLPADATIAVTEAQHAQLIAAQAAGEVITFGASGPTAAAYAAPAPTPAALLAYAEQKRAAISAGGVSVNIAAAGAAPQMVEVGTDAEGLAFLANAVQLTATAPGTAYDWDQAEPVTLDGAQILVIQAAVGLFQQQLFTQKSALRAAIAAGTITTTAQIDDPTTAALPAWPQNS